MISVVSRGECETFREEVDGRCDKCFALEIIICFMSYVYCVHLMKVKYVAKRKPSEQVDKWFAGDSRASSCLTRQCLTHLLVKLHSVFQLNNFTYKIVQTCMYCHPGKSVQRTKLNYCVHDGLQEVANYVGER